MYVGITGFTSRDEVTEVLPHSKLEKPIMIGVLATETTLRGRQKKNNPNRYPKIGSISGIFPKKSPSVLNLVHYSTKDDQTLLAQLVDLTEIAGTNLDGIQLNMTWPKISSIAGYKKEYPQNKIILQVGPHALSAIKYSPELLLGKIKDYKQWIDGVLIDFSGGIGKPLDTERAMTIVTLLKGNISTIGVVIAGGISPLTINRIRPIIEKFPDLGIDAESGLRNQRDFLNTKMAREYIANYFAIIS